MALNTDQGSLEYLQSLRDMPELDNVFAWVDAHPGTFTRWSIMANHMSIIFVAEHQIGMQLVVDKKLFQYSIEKWKWI